MPPSNSTNNASRDEPQPWLFEAISALGIQLGIQITPDRNVMYAEALSDLPRAQLEPALFKLRLEWKEIFFPPVANIRELALGRSPETETHAAWNTVLEFTRRYVDCNPFGEYGPAHGWYKNYPKLSDRILQTVRIVGGWKALKLMNHQNEPFIRKAFFEAYEHAAEVMTFPAELLAQMPMPRQLQPVPAQAARETEPNPKPAPGIEVIAKPMPNPKPLSEADIRDRREMLRQQTAELAARKPK